MKNVVQNWIIVHLTPPPGIDVDEKDHFPTINARLIAICAEALGTCRVMINQTEFSQIRLNLKLSKIVRSTSKALHFVGGMTS